MRNKTFYHYTRFFDEIKKEGKLWATSYAKTNTYDFVLDFCPEILLNKSDIKKLRDYQSKSKNKIKKIHEEWNRDIHYQSAYTLNFQYKNKKLKQFFKQNWYILAFSEMFEKGWVKSKHESKGSNIFIKIGNKYIKFKITDYQYKKSFVLEQKYWMQKWMNKVMAKKFGKKWWQDYIKYDKIFYKEGSKLDERGKAFMAFFAKNTFGRYYLSIKKLSSYKNEFFKVPEFWIFGDVPLSCCVFGEVGFKIFEKITGFSEKDIKERGIKNYDIAIKKRLK